MVEDSKIQEIHTPKNEKTKKKRKKKCHHCKKKLSLMNYTCRCCNTFCPNCRLPEDHNCTFDMKTYLRKKLEKSLVKVVPDKIIKI